jgi:hypothetical protein
MVHGGVVFPPVQERHRPAQAARATQKHRACCTRLSVVQYGTRVLVQYPVVAKSVRNICKVSIELRMRTLKQ